MHPFAAAIETWYGVHRRQLPWRETTDPYLILVSELILQQTRVAQGLDYYLRFVERFPTAAALAAADEDEVLRMWQGLGYYSRARHLHAAAKRVVEQGGFPDTESGVRALPGVGPYTAAAILSFAFGRPLAVVDGNVYRVLARYFALSTPIDTTQGKKEFAALAEELLDKAHPALYNQALMDFGALQCTPASPRCEACPLADSCRARAEGLVPSLPKKQKRTAVTTRFFVYLFVRSAEGKLWLHRRPAGDIWQGLYEPPLLEFPERPDWEAVARHPFLQQLAGAGFTVQAVAADVVHQLTHRRLCADAYEVQLHRTWPLPEGYLAVEAGRLADYAMPRLVLLMLEKMANSATV